MADRRPAQRKLELARSASRLGVICGDAVLRSQAGRRLLCRRCSKNLDVARRKSPRPHRAALAIADRRSIAG